MKRIAILVAVVSLLIVAVVPAASAVRPDPVTIEAEGVFGEGAPFGVFTSDIEGCELGTFELPDTLLKPVAGNDDPDKLILNIKVERTFLCDGSDDYLTIRFLPKVRGVPFPQTGPWRIVDGEIGGDAVHGTGTMLVVMTPEGPFETFTGKVHIG